jgi:hypothetical protein
VGNAYANLIKQVCATAGTAMHEAWKTPPIKSDSAMNIPTSVVDLSELAQRETDYTEAIKAHLCALIPWWGATRGA